MKFKFFPRIAVAVLAAGGVFLANSLPAKDVTQEVTMVGVTTSDLERKAAAFQEATTPIPAEAIQGHAAVLLGKITSGAAPVHLPAGAVLLDEEIRGFDFNNGGSVIQISIRGGGVVEPSNISFFLDEASSVTKIVEVQYISDPVVADRGRFTQWADGALIFDKFVSADGTASSPDSAATSTSGKQQIVLAGFSWKKFNDCLSSHGIAAWVIAAIGTACGLACGATLGAGCAVCIASIGGIGSGVVTNCIKRARR